MNIEAELKQLIAAALQSVGIDEGKVTLERPAELAHGDYSTNVAMVYAKKIGKAPRVLAEELVASMNESKPSSVSAIEIAGPGFINFRLSETYFDQACHEAIEQGSSYGNNTELSGQHLVFDYTDPNPFKVFHIGHLMSNAIGESLTRIAEASGARVTRICYGGDVGPHVAKTIWGMQQTMKELPEETAPLSERTAYLGAAYVLGSNAYEDDPTAKAQIDALNKLIFANDPSVAVLYEKGKRWSITHFEEIYRDLGTHFDIQKFESEVQAQGAATVRAHIGDVFVESDGAIVYQGDPSKGLHTRVFINGQGLPTYEAKEIGLTEWKFSSFAPIDRSVVITATEQNDYFKVVIAALEDLHPEFAGKLTQIGHGMMRFAEGKMSSRKGNVVSGDGLLSLLEEEVEQRFGEKQSADIPDGLARSVAVAAVKYSVLRQDTGKDIIFDMEKALSFEGDSGPYLQYTHARLRSLLAKASGRPVDPTQHGGTILPLERILLRFPEVVVRAQTEQAPHHIANYAIEVAREFNSFYGNTIVLDGSPDEPYKLAVCTLAASVLASALELLGIVAPERM